MIFCKAPPESFLIAADSTGMMPVRKHKGPLFSREGVAQVQETGTAPLAFDPGIARMGGMPSSALRIVFLFLFLMQRTATRVFLLTTFFNRGVVFFRMPPSIGIDLLAVFLRIVRAVNSAFVAFAIHATRRLAIFGPFVFSKFGKWLHFATFATNLLSRTHMGLTAMSLVIRIKTGLTPERSVASAFTDQWKEITTFFRTTQGTDLGWRDVHRHLLAKVRMCTWLPCGLAQETCERASSLPGL